MTAARRSLQKNWLEWTIFGVSTIVVLSVVGLLLYAHFTRSEGPPRLEIVLGPSQPQGDVFAVKITVRNDGATTAEDVHMEVLLRTGRNTERSMLQLPFVPHGTERIAWTTFTADPADGALQARILGYREP